MRWWSGYVLILPRACDHLNLFDRIRDDDNEDVDRIRTVACVPNVYYAAYLDKKRHDIVSVSRVAMMKRINKRIILRFEERTRAHIFHIVLKQQPRFISPHHYGIMLINVRFILHGNSVASCEGGNRTNDRKIYETKGLEKNLKIFSEAL